MVGYRKMCGIAGVYQRKTTVNTQKFNEMTDIITHRGPNDRGVFIERNLALGHRRLSVIDLSEEGRQPFVFMNRYVIVFNGEIYNYRKVRLELEKRGVVFRTKTDTEVLVAAYMVYGEECINYFNGMWAFAIYDREEKILFCSRDRFGVKPFYYFEDGDNFYFASEIKQILCYQDNKAVANHDRLLEFLVCGDLDFTNETLFKNILQLSPGQNLTLDLTNGVVKKNKYYNLSNVAVSLDKYEEAASKFKNLFLQSVNLRLNADVSVGYCLSGGLDSSAIVCTADTLLAKQGKREQHSVSSCFEDKRYDEQIYIDEVIRCTHVQSHKVFPEEKKLFETLDKIIWHMDEPFGSTSIYAQWNVFEEAQKNELTVMLDGQGADEQLAGYTGFYSVLFAYYLKKFQWLKLIREVKKYLILEADTSGKNNAKKKVLPLIASAALPDWLKKRVRKYNLFFREVVPFSPDVMERVYKNRNIYPVKHPEQYILDSMRCGMSALLHYEDRDSMAHSIESRVPFLDYRLVEYIYSLPIAYKIKDGVTKSVMRDGLKDILPYTIRNRHNKLGFVTPEVQWIKKNLSTFRSELESSCDRLYPLIDKKRVMNWFDEKKGDFSNDNFISWRIICAGRWMKVFDVEM